LTTPLRISVTTPARHHLGLGVGTQLALSVARAVAEASAVPFDPYQAAAWLGRGRRSAIGVHGFCHGGFLVDAGLRSGFALSPLVAHHTFPADWVVLLAWPRDLAGEHGTRERLAFDALAQYPANPRRTDTLARLALLDMLPALVQFDCAAFGEALFEFNRTVGEWFAPWQGGVYSHAWTTQAVQALRDLGMHGVGQSSWGPAVFAIAREQELHVDTVTAALARACQAPLTSFEVQITHANNTGAQVVE
jgi:beta-RFAP synthase